MYMLLLFHYSPSEPFRQFSLVSHLQASPEFLNPFHSGNRHGELLHKTRCTLFIYPQAIIPLMGTIRLPGLAGGSWIITLQALWITWDFCICLDSSTFWAKYKAPGALAVLLPSHKLQTSSAIISCLFPIHFLKQWVNTRAYKNSTKPNPCYSMIITYWPYFKTIWVSLHNSKSHCLFPDPAEISAHRSQSAL